MRARLAEPASPIDFARGHGRNSELGRVRRGAPRRQKPLRARLRPAVARCFSGRRPLFQPIASPVGGACNAPTVARWPAAARRLRRAMVTRG